jgi:hypothetical protein
MKLILPYPDFSGIALQPGVFLALRFVPSWHSQSRPDRRRNSKMAVKDVLREEGAIGLM